MREYVAQLVRLAAGRAALKFNRIDFRLPWVRRHFPDARIVHVYRHPRNQWCSMLGDLSRFPAGAPADQFPPHDRFYLLPWVQDLKYHFPFLEEPNLEPYRQSYYLWKLSYLFGVDLADYSIPFERLTADFAREWPRLMAAVGIARVRLRSAAAPHRHSTAQSLDGVCRRCVVSAT